MFHLNCLESAVLNFSDWDRYGGLEHVLTPRMMGIFVVPDNPGTSLDTNLPVLLSAGHALHEPPQS